jgi:hypothetical protein
MEDHPWYLLGNQSTDSIGKSACVSYHCHFRGYGDQKVMAKFACNPKSVHEITIIIASV